MTARTTAQWAALAGVALCASGAAAQMSNIDASRKYSWGENIGYMNWRDADGGAAGVVVGQRALSGFIWSESVGWINMGRVENQNAQGQYDNTDGANSGVNLDRDTGDLHGLAWGENIGWVNFDTRETLKPLGMHARLDLPAKRFRGYAWAPNVGWINLDLETASAASLRCVADFDNSGVVNIDDIFIYLNAWFASDARCNLNSNSHVDIDDLFIYLNAWFNGC